MKGIFEKNGLSILANKYKGIRGFPPMFHSHAEILYVISGSVTVNVDGMQKNLIPNELCIIFPYAVHEYVKAPDAEAIVILFSPDMVQDFEKILLSQKPQSPFLLETKKFLPEILKILDFSKHEDITLKNVAKAYLNAVVGEIITNLTLSNTCSTDLDATQKVLIYCSEHFSDENISIDTVSKDLYISKSYISKIFSSKLDYNFREYINTLRISKAKKYLANTDMKIIDIMYDCGFKNQSSFNRIFLNDCNLTPTEYRKQKTYDNYNLSQVSISSSVFI